DWSQDVRDDRDLNLTDLTNSLQSLMGRRVGITRNAIGLKEAATQIDFWDRYVSTREFTQLKGWELQNLLLVSRLMTAAAAARTGTHFKRIRHHLKDVRAEDCRTVRTGSAGRKADRFARRA